MIELKADYGMFYVPYEDYIKINQPLWYVGFQKVEVEIINANHYHFAYEEDSASNWGNIYADLYIKNGKFTIKGTGSKNFREEIIGYYNWFQKAKNDERYKEMFDLLWFE